MAERTPLLVELDETTRRRRRARIGPWLATCATLQTGYRQLLGATAPLVRDPLVREWLTGVERTARAHEAAVDDLARAFELRRPPPGPVTAVTGAVLATARAVAGQVQGILAGASGATPASAWRNLRQLQLSNLDSLSAFAVAQQLGLAEGRPAVVDIAFPVVAQKGEQQLLLQEIFLEFSADALLGGGDV